MENKHTGMTLIETVIALSIVGIVFFMASPSLKTTYEKIAIDSVMDDVVSAISLAKQTAIMENSMVTWCRSNDGKHCQGKWEQGSIIFTDKNGDRILNENDRLVYRYQDIAADGELTFNSFGNKQYLQLTPRGFTNYQNGNFTFCPSNKDATLARQIVLNHLGRTRVALDKDKDGIVENSKGDPLSCD